jgi:hypothetical protein
MGEIRGALVKNHKGKSHLGNPGLRREDVSSISGMGRLGLN